MEYDFVKIVQNFEHVVVKVKTEHIDAYFELYLKRFFLKRYFFSENVSYFPQVHLVSNFFFSENALNYIAYFEKYKP